MPGQLIRVFRQEALDRAPDPTPALVPVPALSPARAAAEAAFAQLGGNPGDLVGKSDAYVEARVDLLMQAAAAAPCGGALHRAVLLPEVPLPEPPPRPRADADLNRENDNGRGAFIEFLGNAWRQPDPPKPGTAPTSPTASPAADLTNGRAAFVDHLSNAWKGTGR